MHNRAFWRRKLSGNRTRDLRVNRMLRRAGWRVVRIWECALGQRAGAAVKRIANELQMVWPRKNAKSTKE